MEGTSRVEQIRRLKKELAEARERVRTLEQSGADQETLNIRRTELADTAAELRDLMRGGD